MKKLFSITAMFIATIIITSCGSGSQTTEEVTVDSTAVDSTSVESVEVDTTMLDSAAVM